MLHWFARRLEELQKAKRDERGFTLIELLVVVIIIGILAAIAIPVFLSQRESAQAKAAKANIRTAATAEQAAFTDGGAYLGVGALGPHGFNATGTEPAVTGGVVTGKPKEYCLSSAGGGVTWYMGEDYGAPTNTACNTT